MSMWIGPTRRATCHFCCSLLVLVLPAPVPIKTPTERTDVAYYVLASAVSAVQCRPFDRHGRLACFFRHLSGLSVVRCHVFFHLSELAKPTGHSRVSKFQKDRGSDIHSCGCCLLPRCLCRLSISHASISVSVSFFGIIFALASGRRPGSAEPRKTRAGNSEKVESVLDRNQEIEIRSKCFFRSFAGATK